MANRFRLVQQPIASLTGEDRAMFDLVVRMLDDKGEEVLPTEFLAAAERTDLLKNIDRWVVGAAMSFCAARKPHRVFVRLSSDSLRDATLGAVAAAADQGVAHRAGARRDRGQRGERDALSQGSEGAAERAADAGASDSRSRTSVPVAIRCNLLDHVPVNYVKIDGSLMQGLANDRPLQERVKELVDRAHERKIATIAERVEDANTMAVLWQLGIEYIQGYFVNQPEEVVLESRAVLEV